MWVAEEGSVASKAAVPSGIGAVTFKPSSAVAPMLHSHKKRDAQLL